MWWNASAICLCLALCSLPAISESVPPILEEDFTIILNAFPTTMITSGPEKTSRTVLTDDERGQSRLTIIKMGNNYFWASRGFRQLIYLPPEGSSIYHCFLEPNGAGHIKVMNTAAGTFEFYEQMSLGLTIYSYWGTADNFTPGGK